jgi:hypothetical protein
MAVNPLDKLTKMVEQRVRDNLTPIISSMNEMSSKLDRMNDLLAQILEEVKKCRRA